MSTGFMPVQFLSSFPCLQITLLVFAVCLRLLGPLTGNLDLVRDLPPSDSDPEYLVVQIALALAAYEFEGVCDLSLLLLLLFPLLLLLLLLVGRALSRDEDLAFLTCVLSLALLLHAFSKCPLFLHFLQNAFSLLGHLSL